MRRILESRPRHLARLWFRCRRCPADACGAHIARAASHHARGYRFCSAWPTMHPDRDAAAADRIARLDWRWPSAARLKQCAPTGGAVMIPGEIMPARTARSNSTPAGHTVSVEVANTGDRPIQVGSSLPFLRSQSRRCRSTAKRRAASGSTLQPGLRCGSSRARRRSVTLVEMAGNRKVYGFRQRSWERSTGQTLSTTASCRMRDENLTVSRAPMPTCSGRRRRQGPPCRYRAVRRSRDGPDDLWRGSEVRRRQGDPRWHGPVARATRAEGAVDTVITNALIVDAVTGIIKADVGATGRTDRGIGKAGNPDIQPGVGNHQSRPAIRSDPARSHRGGGQDPDGGRLRRAHPLHLSAADRRSADVRRHDDARWRHGTCDGHERDDVYAGAVAHRKDAAGGRCISDEPGVFGQGQRGTARRARRTDQGRRLRAQAA